MRSIVLGVVVAPKSPKFKVGERAKATAGSSRLCRWPSKLLFAILMVTLFYQAGQSTSFFPTRSLRRSGSTGSSPLLPLAFAHARTLAFIL